MKEQALLFGARPSLVGVITWPEETNRRPLLPAVLLLNAGILHHVGPHRLYVTIARRLAALGFVSLRFDFSGIGDSLPRNDSLPFRQAVLQEVQQAMAALHAANGQTQFVLIGLCSGARLSLQAAQIDERVVGAVLINPNAHLHDENDEDRAAALRSRALLHHYRRIALASSFRAKNWRKALTGNLNKSLLRHTVRSFGRQSLWNGQLHDIRERAIAQLSALAARGVRLLHIFSEGDEGLDYFRLVLGKEAEPFAAELIRGANHTFTPLWSQEHLVQVICDWAVEFTDGSQTRGGRPG